MKELAESIEKYGLLSPISVCEDGDEYYVITGVRRFLAVKNLLKLDTIECKVQRRLKVGFDILAQLRENFHRESPSPEELFNAIQGIKTSQGKTNEEIAKDLCISLERVEEILNID